MANLTLVKTESELVRKALDGLVEMDLADFAIHLQTARALWRKHRNLVESPKFPEYLRAPFIAQHGGDPDGDNSSYSEFDPAVVREENLPMAREMAREWRERDLAAMRGRKAKRSA